MDLTFEEFSQIYLGAQPKKEENPKFILGDESLPKSVDWREKGGVSHVKDQGQCGSCWAFSTIGALEGLHFVAKKELVEFSEQALVDCSKQNNGCNGGLMDYAFDYVKTHGIPLEDKYPYHARDGQCKSYDSVFKVSGFTDVPRNSPK